MHVNLWDPRTWLSNNLTGRHLLNAMCNLTHFIVSTITTEHTCGTYSNFFMENAVLLFSMVEILVFDVYSWFKSVPKDMCTALGNINWALARGNQKGMSVEKYHFFLKKCRQLQAKSESCMTSFSKMWKPLRLVPAKEVHFFYTRSHLSALQNCAWFFSTNFQFIFTFK